MGELTDQPPASWQHPCRCAPEVPPWRCACAVCRQECGSRPERLVQVGEQRSELVAMAAAAARAMRSRERHLRLVRKNASIKGRIKRRMKT